MNWQGGREVEREGRITINNQVQHTTACGEKGFNGVSSQFLWHYKGYIIHKVPFLNQAHSQACLINPLHTCRGCADDR